MTSTYFLPKAIEPYNNPVQKISMTLKNNVMPKWKSNVTAEALEQYMVTIL